MENDVNLTRYVANRLSKTAYEKDFWGWNIKALELEESFFDRLDRFLFEKCGIDMAGFPRDTVDEENKRREQWRKSFYQRAKKQEVNFSQKTLPRWVPRVELDEKGQMVPATMTQDPSWGPKENMYKIAAVFELDDNKTVQLFHNVFRSRPFDIKQPEELIYHYYCVQKKEAEWYQKSQQLWQKIQLLIDTPEKASEVHGTAEVKKQIELVENEEELLAYMLDHPELFGRNNKSVTAKRLIRKELIGTAWIYAVEEFNERLEGTNPVPLRRRKLDKNLFQANSLMTIITDQNLRTKKDNGHAVLPEEIRSGFPTYVSLGACWTDPDTATVSEEQLRKLIILLSFYIFATDKKREEESLLARTEKKIDDSDKESNRLTDAINDVLTRAGFGDLYAFDVYDALFLYCASSKEPLQTFRLLLKHVGKRL